MHGAKNDRAGVRNRTARAIPIRYRCVSSPRERHRGVVSVTQVPGEGRDRIMSAQGNSTVKWYDPEKAYGFITDEGGQDLFVHRNSIADGRPWLIDGQGVAFTVAQGRKGQEAAEVRVTQDVEEIPASRQRRYSEDRAHSRDSYGGSGYGGGGRGFAPRAPREPYRGHVPSGPVAATVARLDPSGRFLFANVPSIGEDVYVHSTLFRNLYLQQGDEVTVTIELSDRGLRARTIER